MVQMALCSAFAMTGAAHIILGPLITSTHSTIRQPPQSPHGTLSGAQGDLVTGHCAGVGSGAHSTDWHRLRAGHQARYRLSLLYSLVSYVLELPRKGPTQL